MTERALLGLLYNFFFWSRILRPFPIFRNGWRGNSKLYPLLASNIATSFARGLGRMRATTFILIVHEIYLVFRIFS